MERLERQNRRFKVGAVGAALVVAAGVVMAATAPIPRTIAARAFKLVDEHGVERASLDMLAGDPELTLFDAQGNARASLFLGSHGNAGEPELQFDDASGRVRARFFLHGKGEPSFSLFDPQNQVSPAGSIADHNGGPSVTLRDATGAVRVKLFLAPPRSQQNVLPLIPTAPAGTPVLQLFGRDADLEFDHNWRGMQVPSLLVGADNGSGTAAFFDRNLQMRLSLGITRLYPKAGGQVILPESSISAFDGLGNLMARWPLP
ncbi:MAG: hypothetical protein M0002_13525 [Rhodospirillales bacterium]|nr:hypothetical protein [Rhodospirillales bacterium]